MDEKIKQIADYYGYDIQARQCCEELAELIQAICKHSRSVDGEPWFTKANTEEMKHVVEEIADVDIMLDQIEYLLGISAEELDKEIDMKLSRQVKRIEEEKDERMDKTI